MKHRRLKLFISMAYYIMAETLYALMKLAGKDHPRILEVLCYHNVPEAGKAAFSAQLDSIGRHCTILGPDMDAGKAGSHNVVITFDDGFRSMYDNGAPELVRRNIPFALFMPTGFMGDSPGWKNNDDSSYGTETVITAQELQQLPQEYVTVGSHCITHPDVRMLDDAALDREMADSRVRLEELTGTAVTLLAFPYGEYDERALEAANRAGYQRVFGSSPRYQTLSSRSYVFGRQTVTLDEGTLEFYLMIRGGYQWLHHAIALKARLRALFAAFGRSRPAEVYRDNVSTTRV